MVSVSEYCNSFRGNKKRRMPKLNNIQYCIRDDSHPCCYNLVDIKNNITYRLCFKENKNDDDYYYANEIITQGSNKYIFYKPAYGHYTIKNIKTEKEWQIPKKETCIEICEELNQLYKNEK